MSPKRVLGLDYGKRRIGIALSDPLGITAQPFTVLRNQKKSVLEEMVSLIQEKNVETVVIGLPRHMSGQEGEEAIEVRTFGEMLAQKSTVAVYYIDERLTTVAAQRVLAESGMSGSKKRQAVDKLAAVLILQTWLDSQHDK